MGKTSIAQKLCENKKTYFFNIENGLKNTLSTLLVGNEIPEDKILNTVTAELSGGGSLVVLDNAEEDDREDINHFLKQLTGVSLIITSRAQNFNISNKCEIHSIDDEDKICEIFSAYLQNENYSRSELKPLLDFTFGVPLVIEILAKQTNVLLKNGYIIQQAIEYFGENNVHEKARVNIGRDGLNSQNIK